MTRPRLTIVGAGSAYMPGIAAAIAAHHASFAGTTVTLHDIDPDALDLQARLTRGIVRARGGPGVTVKATTSLPAALDGADLVLATFRPGGYAGRLNDESIPLRFDLPGSETVGPGGFAMGLRSVPAILEVAAEMRRSAADDALILDYTNPVQIVTGAVVRAGGVGILGLCDQHRGEAGFLGRLLGVDGSRLELDIAGVNHCTWTRGVRLDGADVTEEAFAVLRRTDPATIDPYWAPVVRLFPRFGAIPSAYLRAYLLRDEMVAEQRAAGRTRAEEIMADLPDIVAGYREAADREDPRPLRTRGGADHGDFAISIAAAIREGRPTRAVLDVPNAGGALPGLATDAIVELPCRLVGRSATPIPVPPFGPEVMAILESVARYGSLAVEAALTGDRATAIAALLAHPLAPAHHRAEELLDAILEANRSVAATSA